jgi:hypothetical protein
MSNLEDRQWYKNLHNGGTLVFVTVTILSFSVGIVQYHRTFTYVPTYCLVKRSSLEKCNTRYTKYESSSQRCLVPIWLVEYEDSGKSEQTTIIDPMFWVDRDNDSNQPDSLKKYEVFMLQCKEYNAYIKPLLFILNRLVGFIGVIILII